MNYRADIDGLRAIAVLAVFIYHLGAPWLPGGFIGVDIFFVISGFLITGIIRKNISSNSFSFLDFFVKRVRRILPALLFMTICIAAVGYFILKPEELVALYKSVATQPFALQNIHFLIEGEYFRGSDRKPLLHTWSLGVEEQFYLVWPVVIFLAFKLTHSFMFSIFVGLMLASFAVNLFLIPISPKASFFLFPARAWELIAGGILAVAVENRRQLEKTGIGKTLVASLGMLLLGIGFFTISSAAAYPGWHALIPVIGTLCLIWAAEGTNIGAILRLKPIVGVGLISYSLYLWHWPLIVYARILNFDLNNYKVILSIVIATFFLSFLSYKLIEEPFRRKKRLTSVKHLFAGVSVTALSLVLLSTVAIKTQGFSFRYTDPTRSMLTASFNTDGDNRCGFVFRMLNPNSFICHTNKVTSEEANGVLIWGNSHAAMWIGLLDNLGQEYKRPVYLTSRNCRPTNDNSFCGMNTQDQVLEAIERDSISDVLLASSWYGTYDIEDSQFESELRKVVMKLVDMDVRIWLVIDTPSGDLFNPIYQYDKNPKSPEIGVYSYSYFEKKFLRESMLFNQIKNISSNIRILDPTVGICPEKIQCQGGTGNIVWYRDGGHLTRAGAFTARNVFEIVFTDFESRSP